MKEKIRKLLEMTMANGCTEGEAIAAVGMAQKLMLKYNLQATELGGDEEIQSWDEPLDEMPGRVRQMWRGRLALTICRYCGCSTFWHHNGTKPILAVVGQASDVANARYLYQFCVQAIEELRRQYSGNGKTWLNNWHMGIVDGIEASLSEAKKAARQEYAQETGTALVVIDEALEKIAIRSQQSAQHARDKFSLRSGGVGGGRINHDARAKGQRDGKSINVTGQRRLQ